MQAISRSGIDDLLITLDLDRQPSKRLLPASSPYLLVQRWPYTNKQKPQPVCPRPETIHEHRDAIILTRDQPETSIIPLFQPKRKEHFMCHPSHHTSTYKQKRLLRVGFESTPSLTTDNQNLFKDYETSAWRLGPLRPSDLGC